MKNLLLAALLALAGCNGCDAVLVPFCAEGRACWPADGGYVLDSEIPNEAHVGACFVGNVVCYGDTGECEGFVLPEDEVCDGQDNDCDGSIDTGLGMTFGTQDPENTCDLCGRCAYAWLDCDEGVWLCKPVAEPIEEVCNGIDDDCDCEVDEGIDTLFFYPEEEYPNTVGIGECRPGLLRCFNGQNLLIPSTVPIDEVCDGIDNDCDFFIDEDFLEEPQSFLIALDISGSMGPVTAVLRDVICDFAIGAQNDSLFAVVTFGDADPTPTYVNLRQDFADAAETCVTMGLAPTWGSGGQEYALEAALVSGGLNWTESVERNVIIFTDEPLQLIIPESYVETEQVCVDVGFSVSVYTEPSYYGDYSALIGVCGGSVDDLNAGRYEFTQILLNKFFGNCQD